MSRRTRNLGVLSALLALGAAWRCVARVDAFEAGLVVGPGDAVIGVVQTPGLVAVWPWQRVVALPQGAERLELRGLEVQSGDGLPLRVDVRAQLRLDLGGHATLTADREPSPRARLLSQLAAATQAEVSRLAVWPTAPLSGELTSAADAGGGFGAAGAAGAGVLGSGRRALERAIAARWLTAAGGADGGAAVVVLARLRPSGDAEGAAIGATIAACRAEATVARGRGERRRAALEAEVKAELAAIARKAESDADALLAAAEADALQADQAARTAAPEPYAVWRAGRTIERALAAGGGAVQLWLGRDNSAFAPLWPASGGPAAASGAGRRPQADGAPAGEAER